MSHCITFPGDLGQHATGDAPPGFKELLSRPTRKSATLPGVYEVSWNHIRPEDDVLEPSISENHRSKTKTQCRPEDDQNLLRSVIAHSQKLYTMCIQPKILYGGEIWTTRLKFHDSKRKLDRISRLAGLSIAGINRTASKETATALPCITPLSDLTLQILLRTDPAALSRHGEPHRRPSPEPHCTPLNLMKAELGRVAKKDAEDQPQTRHPTVEDEDDRRLIQADDFLERVKQYIECGVKRKWMQSIKSQQLKVTGWQLHQDRRPWFSSLTWSRSSVSRINQVISGHLPTREYLHSHGYELKTQNVCCGRHPETRDHLIRMSPKDFTRSSRTLSESDRPRDYCCAPITMRRNAHKMG